MKKFIIMILSVGVLVVICLLFIKLVPDPRPIDDLVYALIVIGGPIGSAYLDGMRNSERSEK